MIININNEKKEYATAPDLEQILNDIRLKDRKGIAVAVNQDIIPRKDWPEYRLNDQDRITLIQATQGG